MEQTGRKQPQKPNTSKPAKRKQADTRMALSDHLGELRKRLVRSVLIYLVLSLACFALIEPVVESLLAMGRSYDFIYLSPSELLLSYVKLAFIAGLVLAAPFILYQIWCFVRVGLKRREKRTVFFTLMGGLLLFLLGAAFAFFIAVPFMLEFLYGFNTVESIRPMISFQSYSSFLVSTMLAFGLVFEMPILATLLTLLGILKPDFLTKNRKYMILVIFTVGAIITPPDVVSQVMVAVPMYVLYEFSILLCKVLTAGKKRREAAEEDGDDLDDDEDDIEE